MTSGYFYYNSDRVYGLSIEAFLRMSNEGLCDRPRKLMQQLTLRVDVVAGRVDIGSGLTSSFRFDARFSITISMSLSYTLLEAHSTHLSPP